MKDFVMRIELFLYLTHKSLELFVLEKHSKTIYQLRNKITKTVIFEDENFFDFKEFLVENYDYSSVVGTWLLTKLLIFHLQMNGIRYQESMIYNHYILTYYENGKEIVIEFNSLFQVIEYAEENVNFSLKVVDDYICTKCGLLYSEIEIKGNGIKSKCNSCGNEVIQLL